MVRHEQVILFILSVVIGLIAGGCAIVFREGILLVQQLGFGIASERVHSMAALLSVVAYPAGNDGRRPRRRHSGQVHHGGKRPESVADVIAASALRGGRIPLRNGACAAIVSAVSLGTGASAGREGPVVHLGATLSSFVAEKLHLGRALSRTLLGCGVATAVAASFNAPIAGVFFALEVVLGHYALSAFAPVVIASVTGTVLSRVYFGDHPAFILPVSDITSFLEFPAFALLGVSSGAVAIIFMRLTAIATSLAERSRMPGWLRPAGGGFLIGLVGLEFPEVLGVGYEATDMALNGHSRVFHPYRAAGGKGLRDGGGAGMRLRRRGLFAVAFHRRDDRRHFRRDRDIGLSPICPPGIPPTPWSAWARWPAPCWARPFPRS